jgi:hypothetical protein
MVLNAPRHPTEICHSQVLLTTFAIFPERGRPGRSNTRIPGRPLNRGKNLFLAITLFCANSKTSARSAARCSKGIAQI